MDWIKNIAGIIFGGGMLIKFIERIYKKRDDKQRIYRQIYDTCESAYMVRIVWL